MIPIQDYLKFLIFAWELAKRVDYFRAQFRFDKIWTKFDGPTESWLFHSHADRQKGMARLTENAFDMAIKHILDSEAAHINMNYTHQLYLQLPYNVTLVLRIARTNPILFYFYWFYVGRFYICKKL